MVIKNVTLPWIAVSDFRKGLEFFTKVLGLKAAEVHEEFSWAELHGENAKLRLGLAGKMEGSESDAGQPKQNAVVTFSVDDIAKAKAELEEKGVPMHGDIIEVPGIVKLQTFSYDGNLFQLVEQLENKTH